jgi:TRAP-type C4-dicarboxylate transport system permease small subunit
LGANVTGAKSSLLNYVDQYAEGLIAFVLLWVVIVIVCIEVFRRYVLNWSGEYSDELARFSLIWLVYIGVPYCIRNRCHIVVDALPRAMPPWLNHFINIVADLCFLLFAILIVKYGQQIIALQLAMHKVTDSMRIPQIFVSSAPVVGCALAVLRLAQDMAKEIKGIATSFKQ